MWMIAQMMIANLDDRTSYLDDCTHTRNNNSSTSSRARSTSSTGSRTHSESNRFLVCVQSWPMRLARTNLR